MADDGYKLDLEDVEINDAVNFAYSAMNTDGVIRSDGEGHVTAFDMSEIIATDAEAEAYINA